VTGRSWLARLFAGGFRRYAADPRFADARVTVAEVNGQPAVLIWSGDSLLAVLIVEVDLAAITELWLVTAPGKLAVAAAGREVVTKTRSEGSLQACEHDKSMDCPRRPTDRTGDSQ
jgi:hypothetical protein